MQDRDVAPYTPAHIIRPATHSASSREPGRAGGGPRQDSLLEIVWRRRAVVAAVTGLALLLGAIYCLLATPIYTATARLFVEPTGAGAKASRDAADRTAFLFTQREVLSSTPVLAVALGRPGILDLKTFAGENSPFTYLKTALDVDVGKKDELVTVSFDSAHREEATQIVAAVVDAYAWFQGSQRTVSATGTASTLQSAKDATETEITTKLKALQDFAIQHKIIGSDERRQSLDGPSVNSIGASVTAAHIETLAAKARVDEVRRITGNDDITSIEAARATLATAHVSIEDDARILAQLRDAEQLMQSVARQMSRSHPRVQAIQQQIDRLSILHRAVLVVALDAATQREVALQDFYATEQRRLIEQNAYAGEYARRQAEIARLETMSDQLDTRIRELKVNDDGKMAAVSVLEAAHADVKPTGPKKSRALAIAGVVGLLLGSVAACVRDRLDTRLKSAIEIEDHIGLTALSVIPPMSSSLSSVARALNAFDEPDSPLAAACRALRTALLFGTRGGRVKTILVTSPSRGDGRTTVASNLAISLAQTGQRVLLIDADLREPALDRVFGVDNNHGLIDLLTPTVFDASSLDVAVHNTFVPNLHVLPAGTRQTNAPELFNHKVLTDLLASVSAEYDHVVIDTPPSRVDADARIVASGCDVTLMVLRLGKHDRHTVAQTRSDLTNVGANVVGVVLNQAPAAFGISSWDNDKPVKGLTDAADSRRPPAIAGPEDPLAVARTIKMSQSAPLV